MKHEKPDGVIELGMSGCCCPPGQRKPGMHTCACTTWWRVNEGPWVRYEDLNNVRTLAGAAETCLEFVEAVKVARR
jgi:hypothetical protein